MYYFGYHAFCRLKVLERLRGPYVRVPSRSATLALLRVCTALEFVYTRRWNECETECVTLFSSSWSFLCHRTCLHLVLCSNHMALLIARRRVAHSGYGIEPFVSELAPVAYSEPPPVL